ncbi:aldo/keto reductase [Corallincola platygyrae]|uniref:Aldo/keto reductase n=1 Tax=Corallincola platygyrae TaxID=1193278 RepID=A0ABW4XMW1_9GAMM
MKYKQSKRIDAKLSALGMGCWSLAGKSSWCHADASRSIDIVHQAIEKGINLFDVAPVYGLGVAEEVLGKALKGRRDKAFIASKCGLVWDAEGNVSNKLGAEALKQEIDQCLARLQTDYLDLWQVHWPTDDTPLEETMSALSEIKQSGKIRHIGVSNFSLSQLKAAESVTEIASYQGLYNLLERNASSYHGIGLGYRIEQEILPYCQDKGIAFLPYSPLMQGVLSGAFSGPQQFSGGDVRANNPKLNGQGWQSLSPAVAALKAFAAGMGKPLNEVALNWLIANPSVTSVIAGATRSEQLDKNLGAMDWSLSQSQLDALEQILAPFVGGESGVE